VTRPAIAPRAHAISEQPVVLEGRLLDEPDLAWRRLNAEIQRTLGSIGEHAAGLLQQQPKLGFGMRKTEVSHDPTRPIDVLSDLHRRGSRGHPDAPHPRHTCRA
jgi:hypothetical protein